MANDELGEDRNVAKSLIVKARSINKCESMDQRSSRMCVYLDVIDEVTKKLP